MPRFIRGFNHSAESTLLVGHISSRTKITIELLTWFPATGPDFPATGIQTLGVKPPISDNLLNVLFDVVSTWKVSISHDKPSSNGQLLWPGRSLMTQQRIHLITISSVERMCLVG